MAHDESGREEDIIESNLAYWSNRCANALITLEKHPMKAHQLSALAILAEDIALELSPESPSGKLGRRLRIVS